MLSFAALLERSSLNLLSPLLYVINFGCISMRFIKNPCNIVGKFKKCVVKHKILQFSRLVPLLSRKDSLQDDVHFRLFLKFCTPFICNVIELNLLKISFNCIGKIKNAISYSKVSNFSSLQLLLSVTASFQNDVVFRYFQVLYVVNL